MTSLIENTPEQTAPDCDTQQCSCHPDYHELGVHAPERAVA